MGLGVSAYRFPFGERVFYGSDKVYRDMQVQGFQQLPEVYCLLGLILGPVFLGLPVAALKLSER